MVGTAYTLVIPGYLPIRLNQLIGRHRMVIHRKKRNQDEMVATYFRLSGIPKARGKRRVTLRLTLSGRQKGGDPDAYWKCLLDSLATCGALVDDRRQFCELAPVEYGRGKASATTIILEEMEEQP